MDPAHSKVNFSFNMDGAHSHDVSTIIDKKGIADKGDISAEPLMQSTVSPTCRASIAMYNNEKDIDSLCESLIYCKKFFS